MNPMKNAIMSMNLQTSSLAIKNGSRAPRVLQLLTMLFLSGFIWAIEIYLTFQKIFLNFNYVGAALQVSGDVIASQGQKMISDPMELGLQVVVSHNTLVLVAKPGYPRRASVLENH